jgi:hypothetical protein
VLANPKNELTNLMQFILGVETLEGTVAERRIDEVLAMGSKSNQVYKPRSGGVNKNLKNYNPEQIELTKNLNEELIHIFGYADDKSTDNITPFFDFEGKAS